MGTMHLSEPEFVALTRLSNNLDSFFTSSNSNSFSDATIALACGREVGVRYLVRSLRPEGVCACIDDKCEHIGCRPAVDFVVEASVFEGERLLYANFIASERNLEILNLSPNSLSGRMGNCTEGTSDFWSE
ncbi:hypothetical protein Vadar_022562 [Vaccinium darrowii]|uniref:Uncharacterized protein n=1 Tax=Vaccinium darrowii TaxID=229202 RepID=A0ACB7YFD9_9ERIC|nr:hypothetical protein Vadar_022562 [Vaccinium darrowii]